MIPWFVVNPAAGRVRYGAVEAALRRELAGREATISSEPPRRGRGEDRLVVAVGGDGTVNRVVNRCDPAGLRLGLIPRGSANDLGADLGIPSDLEQAWRVAAGGWYARIDLLSVNGARFVTCGGLGLATGVPARANVWKARTGWTGRLARSLGPLVYPLATVAEVRARAGRPLRATIHVDGVTRSVDLAALVVSNQARFGRWFSASPLASNRDGHMHLCGIEAPRSRTRLLRVCLELLRGRPERCREIFQQRTTSMTVETDEEVTFFGDGEALVRGRSFRFEVLPRALKVAVPPPAALPDRARRGSGLEWPHLLPLRAETRQLET